MSDYQNNSIFWVETAKIRPNPFQPRREFDQRALEDLADSIRQYGVLQPLVVTRIEEQHEDGGISVYYELIAGERRLRAALIAGLEQVPVIIRKETSDKIKLELAIIENLQREDLNPIDRALAFEQLYKEFNLTHSQIGKKMGKSRVYVSNSLRLLSLPDEIKQGLMDGQITEGHTRPLLMLADKPEEQLTLFREIRLKKLSVRDSEKIARSIAQDRVRKKKFVRDPRILDYEKKLSDNLGTRVQIEQKEHGGKITIDYFSVKDLEAILASMKKVERNDRETMMDRYEKEIEQKEEYQSQEKESQQSIAGSTPISFQRNGEPVDKESTPEFQVKKTSDENISAQTKSFEKNKTYGTQQSEHFNSEPENFLEEYHHNSESGIERYHQELPAFVHKTNEEIMISQEYQNNKDNVQKPEEVIPHYEQKAFDSERLLNEYHSELEDEIETYHQELPAFVHKANEEIMLHDRYKKENSISTPQQHEREMENIQTQHLDNHNDVDQGQFSYYQQNTSTQNIQQYHGYVDQSENTQAQNHPLQQNQSYHHNQQQSVKKKGFLGRLFN